jgi:hypothetical protein
MYIHVHMYLYLLYIHVVRVLECLKSYKKSGGFSGGVREHSRMVVVVVV